MVLLKNDGVLPLQTGIKKIAVVGPLAESVQVLHGNYSGTASHATTALEGIRKQFSDRPGFVCAGHEFPAAPKQSFQRRRSRPADGKPGLKGEYFSGDFAGTPQPVRVDTFVDLQLFHPDAHALTPPAGLKEFSVRWTGFLTPAESGDYRIGLLGSMHRLWLDDKLIVDDRTPRSHIRHHDRRISTKGHRYALKIEYMRGAFGTKLVWLPVSRRSDYRSCRGGQAQRMSWSQWSDIRRNSKAKR